MRIDDRHTESLDALVARWTRATTIAKATTGWRRDVAQGTATELAALLTATERARYFGASEAR